MATSTLPSVLPIIPEDRPLPTSPTNPPPKSDSKWSTIRRVVKRYCTLYTCATTVCVCVSLSLSISFYSQALQFVGLEHSQSTQEHQEHVQRSIVVGKMEEKVKKLNKTQSLDCDQSLVNAIVPHQTGKKDRERESQFKKVCTILL